MQSFENNITVLPTKITNTAFEELELCVKAALETYSNVHRGTGHFSIVTTELFEKAREVIIEYLGLDRKEYIVIFCTAYGLEIFKKQLLTNEFHILSSRNIGLPLGIRALVTRKNNLPKGIPFQTGGSVAKIISPNSVIWADAPEKFEAGTPCVINAITLAIALLINNQHGDGCFKTRKEKILSISEILYKDELIEYSGSTLLSELRKLLVGYNLQVPTADGEKPFINLDNAASTPTFLPVWNVISKIWRLPENAYADIVQEVKKILVSFLGTSLDEYETIFTYNATEAINVAARLIQNEFGNDSETVILNTLLEHNSNELPWRHIPGASLTRLPINNDGFINLNELENILIKYNLNGAFGRKRIRLVTVSGASNVLGTFNDIMAISKIVHKYNTRLLVDAAQLAAHRSIDMNKCEIDYLALSGHKVYAPFGSGVLIVRKEFLPADHSELEKIKASGEENITGIAGLGKAVLLLQRIGMDNIESSEKELLCRLLKGLSRINGITIFGIKDPDSKEIHQKGGIVTFSLNRVPHNLAARELAELGGIGVRNGCFCTHLLVKQLLKVNPVRAFAANISMTLIPRLTKTFLPGLVRISIGLENDENDIDRLIEILEKIAGARYSTINKLLAFNHNGTPFLSRTKVQDKIEDFLKTRIQRVYSIPVIEPMEKSK